ncbi:MAG: 6-carboxytetrahydropterin synthase [Planctomycetota bacterium]|nr:6-carboxytetrahydropterin synthase [Planctomycetota bacterium]
MHEPVVEITRREEFSAAHRLHNPAFSAEENRRLYGICNNENGHGHNYAFEVTVRGPVPAATGMVMDLNLLMVILREEIVSVVDHKHLNLDVPFLAGIIPTAENVAVAFWGRIEPRLKGFEGCRLHRVRVYESRNNFVDYHGPTR